MENLREWLQINTMDFHQWEHWIFNKEENNWCFTHRKDRYKEEYTHMPEWSKTLSETFKQEVCVINRTDTNKDPGWRNHYICLMHEKEDDRILELRVHYSLDKDWIVSYINSATRDRSSRFVKPAHAIQLDELKQHFLPLLLQSNEYRLAAVTGAFQIENENAAVYL